MCVCVCVIRIYEQVSDAGLFLFNDALVLTRRSVQHTPFSLAHRSTHTFLASVALGSLAVREIRHTRCEPEPSKGNDAATAFIMFRVWRLNDFFDNVFLCRRASRFCPGGSASLLGLRHGERRGERALPVRAAFSHERRSDGTPVTRRRGLFNMVRF